MNRATIPIEIPVEVILQELMKRLTPDTSPAKESVKEVCVGNTPDHKIGDIVTMSDGVECTYAGRVIYKDQPAYPIYVINKLSEQTRTFSDNEKWCKEIGGEAPNQLEAMVVWTNLGYPTGHNFFAREYYWTGETTPDVSVCAFVQGFGDGSSYWVRKSGKCRGFAVRRSLI